jgi:hypothetical protein
MKTQKELQDKLQKLEKRLYELEERGTNHRLIETYLTRIELLDWVLEEED